MKRIIHQDQVELISSMKGWFNIQKSIIAIYHTNSLKKKNNIVISIDTEKDWQNLIPVHSAN